MKIPQDYFERVYAGWLGKIMGIRLGAAIEGWSYEQIQNVYGELTSYPVAYKNFAADDDSNGPLFFIRALEDCRKLTEFSAQDVAEALLNYAPYEHGFFWWGGYGVSTEHTAYLNLRNGIPAPRSGSILQNGHAVAEQIGGQIFIDPWGLVAPGNPELAASLATKAASVTHDGNGIYGGVYVAVCISLAFIERDLRSILDTALTYIPNDCEYARVTRAVMDFYDKAPSNWRACFQYVHENFGYDKYPGSCHIIPNAAVMILAMLYGGGDYANTVNICNMCGWDTDCNVGNVGSILGVFTGLAGLDYEKWIAPVGDFLACSGVVGSLNAVDVPFGASYFARLAYKLSGEEIPEKWRGILTEKMDSCHFEYPRSTHAIRVRTGGEFSIRNTAEAAHSGGRSLRASVFGCGQGSESFIYKQTYYGPEDFDDSRYDPFFCPLIYPGQSIHLSVMPAAVESGITLTAQVYARNGKTKQVIRGERVVLTEKSWHKLSMRIPPMCGYVDEAGVILCGTAGGFATVNASVYLDDLYFDGAPEYSINFAELNEEVWGGTHREISQFAKLKGVSSITGEHLSLSCCDFAEIYTGHYNWKNYTFTATLQPVVGERHFVNFRVQGAIRSYAAGLAENGQLVLAKNSNGYKILAAAPFAWACGKSYTLRVTAAGDALEVEVNGLTLRYVDAEAPFRSGSIGASVHQGSHCLYSDFSVTGKE